ncbi:variable surface lipoprotein [Mycoplasmopsis bovis]|uniref:variable surface lipoprotein n=1 Tax=Mycoplasmopsis bovis TaxID=28903 RepID=UPI0029620C4A|nr:variable surface lipoprotein [Mycoplasmopsis bovis]
MKKSKFLLLGSVASLASIPFVAAKCGETKEEKKPEADKPADKQPGDDMKKDNDKSKSDKDKNEKDMTDKDKKDQEKSEKDKVENTKIDDSKINKNLGSFPKGLITNAVRQKDIRDKIVGILKTQNFNLDVNYEKHEAKVTLSNGQVIIFTFKEEKKPEADKPADKQPGDDIKKRQW